MNVQDQVRSDEPRFDDFPTLCTIPLRAEWFDDAENLETGIVRGID
ncbi:hypothetical protein C8D88_10845 [Lentzea atacamensis]|uniref:Uncharacterized protein n=1 Tax=Lentzea atacamensis TaxID=531938 RepID=A0A316HWT8_9PSEU|nr:hypothetical protein C8D88_10845 [Lentzea atacamensis]